MPGVQKLVIGQMGLSPGSVKKKKVSLEHCNTHVFTYCLLLLSSHKSKKESLGDTVYSPQSLKCFLFGPLQHGLPTPAI